VGLDLSLALSLALCFAVDLAEEFIDLAEEVVVGRVLWAARLGTRDAVAVCWS